MREWPEGTIFERHSWHFHKRLLQRTGLTLVPGEYTKIVRQIIRNQVPKLSSGAGKELPVYRVELRRDPERIPIKVIFDNRNRRLVSVKEERPD